ncbi:HAD family phosphatase [Micromonospora sp. DPT]|uniref:HAD family hydrolase n=1 Tax=Micromonospora sp. DPT TaxID=3142975 RepID=UPI003209C54D
MTLTYPVHAVWTDFGGVLTPPTRVTLEDFCLRVGVAPDLLLAAMRTVGDSYGTDPMAPLDTPLVAEETWARQVETVLAERYGVVADLSRFGERWFAGRPANQSWVRWLRRARRKGVFVGMLSNMVPSWDAQWRRMVPADGTFDDVVMSFEVGHRKPDPEIFHLAAARAGVPAGECLLVDDLPENCAGARAAGWQAVEFTGTDEAVALLEPVIARRQRVAT